MKTSRFTRRLLQYSAVVLGLLLVLRVTPVNGQNSTYNAAEDGETYDTVEMIERTLEALPNCLKYCLLGIEIRIRYTGYTLEIYFVPRVEHHMAALHVMTSDQFPKEAYTDWADIFGVAQAWMLEELAELLGYDEAGGRQTRHSRYGKHQATVFKETEFMGHPVAILPDMVDGNGNVSIPAGTSGGGSEPSVSEFLNVVDGFSTSWASWAVGCYSNPDTCAQAGSAPAFPSDFLMGFFDVLEAANQILGMVEGMIDFAEMAEVLSEIAQDVGSEAGYGGGVKIDYLLCSNDIEYFYPYYLSGPDALFWRDGFPITDAQHATTIMNPFSSDVVKPSKADPGENWGHIYPRAGFVNNDHPGRVAPVASVRGAAILGDTSVKLRPKKTTDGNGDWQKVSPEYTTYCPSNIADLPIPVDPAGGYAFNIWPRYECPLSTIGILVAFIPYRYCFEF